MPKSQTLGARVAQARRELGVRLRRDVSASDMAKALGVSPATVYRWESDEKSPNEESLARLAKFLEVTPAFIRYGVTGDAPAEPRPDVHTMQPTIIKEVVAETKKPTRRKA